MKKILVIMVSVAILGLLFAGCSEIANITSPESTTEGVASLTRNGEVSEIPLYAGQDEEVGTVEVTDDGGNLCVQYQLSDDAIAEGWLIYETHLAVASDSGDIPQNKKGNPIPGQFPYGDDELMGVESWPVDGPFCIALDDLEVECDEELYIAAHAVVRKVGCMDVFSGDPENMETFSAYGGSTCDDTSERTGTAVAAWDGLWDSDKFPYTDGIWIWESEYVKHPVCGDVVDFEKVFSIPGDPINGNITISVDNAYEAFLNGNSLGSVGLSDGWRESDLTEDWVESGHVFESHTYSLDGLVMDGNLLRFECANEYNHPDDGDPSIGTVENNPGGLIYEAEICYYEDEETAWAEGTRFVDRGNWATYFTYTVECPED